jgi:phosphate transport system substrate-binding protein
MKKRKNWNNRAVARAWFTFLSWQPLSLRPNTMTILKMSAPSIFALAVIWFGSCQAHSVGTSNRASPGYSPAQQIVGTIRIWGPGGEEKTFIESLLISWEEAFRRYEPGIRFENRLVGDASGIGGLYTGAADLALMTREILPTEIDGYEQALGHKPSRVVIATGSLDAPHHEPALVIFVHKDNPVSKLTLRQVDAIFGADHRRGSRAIRTWGDVGLTAEWTGKPIHPYGYGLRSDIAHFFEQTALAGSEKWSCELREVGNQPTDAHGIDAGQLILEALGNDRYGIAVSSLAYMHAGVKPLLLAEGEGGKYYPASPETVSHRQYPLARTASIYFDRSPGKPVDPKIKEFLNYVLGEEGQKALSHETRYFPLTPELAEDARGALQ